MVVSRRSAAESPIEAVRAASSASSASEEVAMPRGVPVEPEVSLTTAVSGMGGVGRGRLRRLCPELAGTSRPDRAASRRGSAGGRARRGRGGCAGPRDSGVWASSSSAASPARRRARSEARKPGPLAAARPTTVPGGEPGAPAPRAARPAARARASTSPTVARRSGETTRGASGIAAREALEGLEDRVLGAQAGRSSPFRRRRDDTSGGGVPVRGSCRRPLRTC